MLIARSWVLAAVLSLSAVSLGACSGDDGGSGGSGGSGDGGSGNTGQGATGQGGTGQGGAGQGGAGQGGQTTNECAVPACYVCASCTRDGACQAEWNACLADPGCPDLYTCYQTCMDADTACRMTCDATYPDNAASFGAFRTCYLAQCMNCPM